MNTFKRVLKLLEGEDERAVIRRRKAADVKSGRMSKKQRIARAFVKAKRQGRTKTSSSLMSRYMEMEGEKKK